MKLMIFLLAVFPGLCFAQSRKIKLELYLQGMPDGIQFYLQDDKSDEILDSSVSKQAQLHFTYHKNSLEPAAVIIASGDKNYLIPVFIEDRDLKLSGKFNDFYTYSFSPSQFYYLATAGSKTHNDYVDLMKSTLPYQDSIMIMNKIMHTATTTDTGISHSKIFSLTKAVRQKEIDFIRTHGDSYISTMTLLMETQSNGFTKDQILSLFNMLSKEQQHSEKGQIVLKALQLYKNPKIGDSAPLFSMRSIDGKTVNLSDYKGKNVLLLFWASWCDPCIADIPDVKKLYEKYKNKNLVVIAISLDENRAAWTNAVRKYCDEEWIHVSDLKWRQNEAALIYGVNGIPAHFLVDAKGMMAGVYMGDDELTAWLAAH